MSAKKNAVRMIGGMGAAAIAASLVLTGISSTSGAASAHVAGHVLTVGTYNGKKGQYATIQAAVDAAHTGDWILVAPGNYHETDDYAHPPTSAGLRTGGYGAVTITTPGIHLRGLNRNTVIIDGTKAGSPSCSASAGDQTYGPVVGGKNAGRNGIVVFKASKVSIDNLTVCNFNSGTGDTGNGIWWNGGAGTGTIGMSGYSGSYLSADMTYFGGEQTAGTYGIFSSDAAGPATWDNIFGANFNDSGMYVGACQQLCNIVINHARMENNALGYSGTNSGGAIVIENSTFAYNKDGLDTNTQIAGDPPAPQNGLCPKGATSPITHTHSCWVVMNSVFNSNNNPNTPVAGTAGAGPLGTGMTISGGRNDTVMNNLFENNGAWGALFVPYPDSDTPRAGTTCAGTGGHSFPGLGCIYDPQGDAMLHNTFKNNGFFKNPTNGDFGQIALFSGLPQNCYVGNVHPDGIWPTNLETAQATCGTKTTTKTSLSDPLLGQALCDTGFGACPAGSHYPAPTGVKLEALPKDLPSMPNPCAGVPDNIWCKSGKLL